MRRGRIAPLRSPADRGLWSVTDYARLCSANVHRKVKKYKPLYPPKAKYRAVGICPLTRSSLSPNDAICRLINRCPRHLVPIQLWGICLSEVIHKTFALSRVFLLSSGGGSVLLVKKKAPSRSGFPLSMHVVLKTRHVNPNIHVRRY